MADAANSELLVERRGAILEVTFNRPEARNALTWKMYDGLVEVCTQIDSDPSIRALLLKGAGEKAFVAGTDIGQFEEFDSAAGIAYEARISAVLAALLALDIPVIAAVRGFCVGGGLAIAACADLRVASSDARFGVPIARTLGNTLSASSVALLEAQFGRPRVASMLIAARLLDANEASAAGFVSVVDDEPENTARDLAEKVARHAPLTVWASKELLRRSLPAAGSDEDIVGRVYGSDDFAAGVAAFRARTPPQWSGA